MDAYNSSIFILELVCIPLAFQIRRTAVVCGLSRRWVEVTEMFAIFLLAVITLTVLELAWIIYE